MLLTVAKNLSMLCVPEGGMNYDWDLTYIIDGMPGLVYRLFGTEFILGMTTIEHALPIPELYEDVLTLYAMSGTGSTPTHIVNYGGAWGEQLVWANNDVPNDPKYILTYFLQSDVSSSTLLTRLRRFTRHDILQSLSETTSRPDSCAYFTT